MRGVSRKAGRKPISVLVTNFDRDGLTHNELETLLHEFGHVLHGVLSQTEYNQHSGTSVERDFVEAPSQMYEEWASRMESLALMRDHCSDLPADRRVAGAAHPRGEEIRHRASTTAASFSTRLSTWRCRERASRGRAALERRGSEMEGATPMGHVDGTAFPGTFEHIASGYAAGYYGYMWAKVIALDLISAFGPDLMNEATGRRFRELILSPRQRRARPRPRRALPRASRFERCVLRRDPRRIDLCAQGLYGEHS